MVNSGPNTNGSQFSICTTRADWLNGKNVVFGHVLSGLDVIKKMERYGRITGIPMYKVVITACGELT